MKRLVSSLLNRLDDEDLADAGVIPWSSPVLSFGDATRARVATLGLNPSNREFVDDDGNELDGERRRFHTLTSLGLESWSDAKPRHVDLIADACRDYFAVNPYDLWFRRLDRLLEDLQVSYYSSLFGACHLDLVPFATADKWTDLTRQQRQALLDGAGDVLGTLVRDSNIEVLILNGSAVVQQFERAASVRLDATTMTNWTLRRQAGPDVKGVAYTGHVKTIAGTRLRHEIRVLGYNHNIQSSFGVSTRVTTSIRRWLGESVKRRRP
jgi:hypothetical protein